MSIVAAMVLALGLGPEPLPAGDPVTFEYSAPPTCPDTATVRRSIDQMLEWVPDSGTRHTISAIIVVDRTAPSLFRLDLSLDDGETVRRKTLRGPSCVEVTQTAAMLVAIAVDPPSPCAGTAQSECRPTPVHIRPAGRPPR